MDFRDEKIKKKKNKKNKKKNEKFDILILILNFVFYGLLIWFLMNNFFPKASRGKDNPVVKEGWKDLPDELSKD